MGEMYNRKGRKRKETYFFSEGLELLIIEVEKHLNPSEYICITREFDRFNNNIYLILKHNDFVYKTMIQFISSIENKNFNQMNYIKPILRFISDIKLNNRIGLDSKYNEQTGIFEIAALLSLESDESIQRRKSTLQSTIKYL